MAKSWRELREKGKLSSEALDRIDREVDREVMEMTMRELREKMGFTQEEAAKALQTAQGNFSRLERRDDHLISTLRKVVEALGGELEVSANFGDRRIKIA